MSTGISALAVVEFDSQVKAAYQTSGSLRRKCRVKTGVVGTSYTFKRANRTMATRRVPQTLVVPMGQTYGTAVATISDWNAAEYTDVFDMAKTNSDERAVVAANIGAAMGRREDQLLLDALDAANAAASVGVNIGGANTGLNYTKVLAIHELFNRRAVPRNKRVLVIGAKQETDLLNIAQFTSGDYVTKNAVETGTLPPILGMTPIIVEDRDEGGLPYGSNIRTCYAYDMDALGLAVGIEQRTEVNYVPQMTSWLANGLFSAGATVIDAGGVIEVACYE